MLTFSKSFFMTSKTKMWQMLTVVVFVLKSYKQSKTGSINVLAGPEKWARYERTSCDTETLDFTQKQYRVPARHLQQKAKKYSTVYNDIMSHDMMIIHVHVYKRYNYSYLITISWITSLMLLEATVFHSWQNITFLYI